MKTGDSYYPKHRKDVPYKHSHDTLLVVSLIAIALLLVFVGWAGIEYWMFYLSQ